MITWLTQSIGPLAQLLLVSTGLFIMPGLAVLRLAWPAAARTLDPAERFGLAIGISLALPPILLYLFRLLGLTWSAAATWGYIGLSLVVVVLSSFYGSSFPRRPSSGVDESPDSRLRGNDGARYRLARNALAGMWAVVLLILITLFATVIRLYAVRDLRAGLFGDSVHHTLIAQLLLDNGGLFDSWQPYAPLASFTYHFGFHANVAFYAWLTGTPATLSVVIIGQMMNAATAPLAYLLISRLVRTDAANDASHFPTAQLAGLWAAALTAFASIMPFYYSNWGRYTQLAGQLLLPAATVVWVELVERAGEDNIRRTWPLVGLAALLTLALMLTHYIVTLWTALFVASYVIISLARRASLRAGVAVLIPAALSAGIALVAAVPWIRNTLNSGMARNTTLFVSGAVDPNRIALLSALGPVTPEYLRGWVLALAGAGVVFALAQRQWRVVMLLVWAGLMVLTITPQTFGLPGTGIVDQHTAYMGLYLVVLPLAAYAIAAVHAWTAAHIRRIAPALSPDKPLIHVGAVACATLVLGVWGATWLPNAIEPQRQMLTAADERAMTWIRDNVPADARFLVNTFPAYAGTLIAGTDGGWWLPLMTRRTTTLPPMTYGGERWERDDFYLRTNTLAQALRGRPLPDGTPVRVNLATPDNLQHLRADGVTHVYIGANATPGPEAVDHIDASALRGSDAFRVIYDRDGVQIFQLR